MDQPLASTSILIVALISLATFYVSISASLFPQVLRLYRYIATKVHEYQALDRGDTLTLLRDAGLSQEQSLWFYDAFYAHASGWERCLIKLYVRKHCIRKDR